MKLKKVVALLLSLFMMIIAVPPSVYAAEKGQISLETTLTDGVTLKGSKKTFDVIARLDGQKISSEVTLNGEKVNQNWDDQNKTSYTLKFTQEGKNTVVVRAFSGDIEATKTYNIIYKKAAKGELIGYATWTVEGLTIGRGFIIEPTKVPIYEGENSAQALDRLLTEHGYSYNRTGKLESSFYLSTIGDGGELDYGCKDEDKIQPLNPPVNIEDKVPERLKKILEDKGNWPTDELYDPKCLGEFDYTYMSGWMYALNNVFPNVGFADSYPVDGDVIRVQFTLYGYGADIGGGYAMGGSNTDYYEVSNKDRLMSVISSINSAKNKGEILKKAWVKSVYDEANKIAVQLDATQKSVDEISMKLDKVIKEFELQKLVIKDIENLPQNITLDDQEKVMKIKENFDKLTTDAQKEITNIEKLNNAIKKIEELKEILQNVIKEIDNLPEDITLKDEEKVMEVKIAFDKLSVSDQKKVTNAEKLNNAIKKIQELVIEEIDNLPENITLDDQEKVMAVKANFDKLSSDVQKGITNVEKLNNAIKKIEELNGVVKKLIKDIDNLPENIILDDEEKVMEIKKQFDMLSSADKKKVTNAEKLNKAIEKIEELNKNLQKIIKDIDSLPEEVTLKDEEKVMEIKKEFDELSVSDQKKVTNAEKLNNAIKKIQDLKIPLTGISLNITSLVLDKSAQENLIVIYKEENTTDDKTVQWTSSDDTVVTVKDGKVTALKAGEAVITAKVGKFTATCKVTVPKLSTKPVDNQGKDITQKPGETLETPKTDKTAETENTTKSEEIAETPKTGDKSPILMMSIVFTTALVALVVLSVSKKKKLQ
ncbi:Ig-like domain-containing protein [Haloimpatiens lingqiaonensis]|uniref:Ig-like domain-containing protein n=1 Tax=Haloimpatiens lingqiaonensis TaxID=1380675 RepID=UPI001FA9D9D0|nr:Ig-like domain-containing protein [Haloimpatiens lingqiaonensis]